MPLHVNNEENPCFNCKERKPHYHYLHFNDTVCMNCFVDHAGYIRIVVDAILNKLVVRSASLNVVLHPKHETIEESAALANARVSIVDKFQSDILELHTFVRKLYCFFSSVDNDVYPQDGGTSDEIEAHNARVNKLKNSFMGLGMLWFGELGTLKDRADNLRVSLLQKVLVDAGVARQVEKHEQQEKPEQEKQQSRTTFSHRTLLKPAFAALLDAPQFLARLVIWLDPSPLGHQ